MNQKLIKILIAWAFVLGLVGCGEIQNEFKRQQEGIKANQEFHRAARKYDRAVSKKIQNELRGRRNAGNDKEIYQAAKNLRRAAEKYKKLFEKRGREFDDPPK